MQHSATQSLFQFIYLEFLFASWDIVEQVSQNSQATQKRRQIPFYAKESKYHVKGPQWLSNKRMVGQQVYSP